MSTEFSNRPEFTLEPPPTPPASKPPVDKSTKLIFMIFGGVLVTGLLAFGLFVGYNNYKETQANRAHELMEANLEDLMRLNTCSKFTDAEQSRLESARNSGPERQKVVLAQIHEERREFWLQRIKESNESLQDVSNRTTKAIDLGVYSYISNTLESQKQEVTKNLNQALIEAAGFQSATEKIKNWKPMTWEQYKKSNIPKKINQEQNKAINA